MKRAADNPVASLRDAVAVELRHGVSRDEMYELLDAKRLEMREQGRDDDEDRIADVQDFLVGFCSPHARL